MIDYRSYKINDRSNKSDLTCQVQWIDCNGKNTRHDAKAIAWAVCTEEHHVKRYAICAAHMQTLLKKTLHHDPLCIHPAQFSNAWSIVEL